MGYVGGGGPEVAPAVLAHVHVHAPLPVLGVPQYVLLVGHLVEGQLGVSAHRAHGAFHKVARLGVRLLVLLEVLLGVEAGLAHAAYQHGLHVDLEVGRVRLLHGEQLAAVTSGAPIPNVFYQVETYVVHVEPQVVEVDEALTALGTDEGAAEVVYAFVGAQRARRGRYELAIFAAVDLVGHVVAQEVIRHRSTLGLVTFRAGGLVRQRGGDLFVGVGVQGLDFGDDGQRRAVRGLLLDLHRLRDVLASQLLLLLDVYDYALGGLGGGLF